MSVYIHICAHKPEQVLHKFDKNIARCGPMSEPPRTVLTQPCLISKSTMQAAAYLVGCHSATTLLHYWIPATRDHVGSVPGYLH